MFSESLKKSGIKYYKIIFANGGKLNRMQDITKSVAKLYDSRYNLVTKVPLFVRNGKEIAGATIYLVGLSVCNRENL